MKFTLEINGEEVPAETCFWTLVLYEMEFSNERKNADMLGDFFGKSTPANDDGEVTLDFTKRPWTVIAKCAWACIKTANDMEKPFTMWAKEHGDVNLMSISHNIADACVDSFFRFGVVEPNEQPEV